MLEFFTNPLVLLSILAPILVFIGISSGYYLSQPRKNRVLKISPESGRGVELEVKSEDATNVYCDPVGDIPPQRFIKRLNAFSIIKKGWMKLQNYALWLGRYGTAYVTGIDDSDIPVSFKAAILNVFGRTLYDQIPEQQRTQIEDGKIGVMIGFPNDPLTPKGTDGNDLPSISEDDINRDNDQRAMENLWEAYEQEQRSNTITQIAFVGCGVAIGIIVSLIFKWGAPTVITPAAQVIL